MSIHDCPHCETPQINSSNPKEALTLLKMEDSWARYLSQHANFKDEDLEQLAKRLNNPVILFFLPGLRSRFNVTSPTSTATGKRTHFDYIDIFSGLTYPQVVYLTRLVGSSELKLGVGVKEKDIFLNTAIIIQRSIIQYLQANQDKLSLLEEESLTTMFKLVNKQLFGFFIDNDGVIKVRFNDRKLPKNWIRREEVSSTQKLIVEDGEVHVANETRPTGTYLIHEHESKEPYQIGRFCFEIKPKTTEGIESKRVSMSMKGRSPERVMFRLDKTIAYDIIFSDYSHRGGKTEYLIHIKQDSKKQLEAVTTKHEPNKNKD